MTRELRSVRTEKVLGTFSVTGARVAFTGRAEDVLGTVVERSGAANLMSDGWSNGYLYLADPVPD